MKIINCTYCSYTNDSFVTRVKNSRITVLKRGIAVWYYLEFPKYSIEQDQLKSVDTENKLGCLQINRFKADQIFNYLIAVI